MIYGGVNINYSRMRKDLASIDRTVCDTFSFKYMYFPRRLVSINVIEIKIDTLILVSVSAADGKRDTEIHIGIAKDSFQKISIILINKKKIAIKK